MTSHARMRFKESDEPMIGPDKPEDMGLLFENGEGEQAPVQNTVEKAGLSRDDHRDAFKEINL